MSISSRYLAPSSSGVDSPDPPDPQLSHSPSRLPPQPARPIINNLTSSTLTSSTLTSSSLTSSSLTSTSISASTSLSSSEITLPYQRRCRCLIELSFYVTILIYGACCGFFAIALHNYYLPHYNNCSVPENSILPHLPTIPQLYLPPLLDTDTMWDYLDTKKLIAVPYPNLYNISNYYPYPIPPVPVPENPSIYYRDSFYFTATPHLVSIFLALDQTDVHKYQSENMDCDDYAIILMSHFHQSFQHSLAKMYHDSKIPLRILPRIPVIPLFGLAYGVNRDNPLQRHAFNVYYHDSPPYWYCVEPQNDTMTACHSYPYDLEVVLL